MQLERDNYKVLQIKTGCLSQFSYYIESKGESVIIDPLRDTCNYIDLLQEKKTNLKYIIETHFHADFVSGHYSLHKKTKAEIILGENNSANFEHRQMKNNEELRLGDIKLRFLHTPGHTLESICIVIVNNNKEEVVFTGDTLFIGDVGRPDLAVSSEKDIDKSFLAEKLFNSLKVLKKLDSECIVLPAHGAGSSCGKNISSDSSSTIGKECDQNYAMLIQDVKEFIKQVTANIPAPPKYFFKTVEMNQKNSSLEDSEKICQKMKELDIEQFGELAMSGDYQILDTRSTNEYKEKHYPKSINSPLTSRFAIFSAYALHPEKPTLIVSNKNKQNEACIRLLRTGSDNIYGYLKGGFENYEKSKKHLEKVKCIEPESVVKKVKNNDLNGKILDVRNCGEFRNHGKVIGAVNLHLEKLELEAKKLLDPKVDYYLSCGGGLRSVIAWGVLNNQGFNVININGGFKGLKENGIETYFECKKECKL